MEEIIQNLSEEGILTITLNRPKVFNAVTCEVCQSLTKLFSDASTNDSVRAIIFTAQGKGFCTGQDLAELETSDMSITERLESCFNPLIQSMVSCSKPIIAAINGVAAGAGMSLALACDIRIMSDAASFTTAFSKIGLVPDSGMSHTLPKLVGKSKAFELLCLSPRVSAEEALGLGLVTEVVASDEVLARANTLASTYANGPTQAYGLIKDLLNTENVIEDALKQETVYQNQATQTSDHQEGLQAFFEKRSAVFKGN